MPEPLPLIRHCRAAMQWRDPAIQVQVPPIWIAGSSPATTEEEANVMGLLCRLNLYARLLIGQRGAPSFFLRVRLRRVFRRLRQAALRCRGVGDDVEIVGD